jgi:hypothetical protein
MTWRRWWDSRYDNPWERAAKIRAEAERKAREIERRAQLTPEERAKERSQRLLQWVFGIIVVAWFVLWLVQQ